MVTSLRAGDESARFPWQAFRARAPRRIHPNVVRLYPTVVGCNAIWLKGKRELFVQFMVCSFRLIEGAIMGGAIRTKWIYQNRLLS